jgi:hypothetical protein
MQRVTGRCTLERTGIRPRRPTVPEETDMSKPYAFAAKDSFRKIARAKYGDERLGSALAAYNGYLGRSKPSRGAQIELPSRRELLPPDRRRKLRGLAARALTLVPPHGLEAIAAMFGDIARFVRTDGTIDPRWEAQNMVSVALPFPIRLAWGNPAPLATKIRCHKVVAPAMVKVFTAVDRAGLRSAVRTYGGCYNYRPKRMGSRPSTHSWGIALDLNPATNGMGTAGDMDPRLVAIFREHGFKWGGDWPGRNKDPMHFQFCTGY